MSRTLVMTIDASGESEPVIVEVDGTGAVVLELVTGESLVLDESELRAALDEAA